MNLRFPSFPNCHKIMCTIFFPYTPGYIRKVRQGKRKSERLRRPTEPEHLPERTVKLFYCTQFIGLYNIYTRPISQMQLVCEEGQVSEKN